MATLVFNGHDLSGTTAQRPTNAEIGQPYFDTTLGVWLVYGGSVLGWRNAAGQVATAPGNGAAVSASNVTASERGNGLVHQTVLTLAATPITVSDTNVGGGTKIYDFPEGRILILGAVSSLAFTTTSALASTLNAGSTINYGVGSVQTTTQASGTLATTQQDLIPTTNATSSATINVAGGTSNGKLAASAQFDGTGTALDAFLNVGVATATDIDGDATLTASGTVTLTWINLGDY